MAKRDGIHYTVHPTPKRKGETEQTYHVRRHYFTTLKSEDIVDHIRYHGSIVDLASYSLVMESLKEEIVELLQSGHDLHIEGLGRFCLQLGTRKTRGKDGRMHAKRYLNPEDITAREVLVKGISFTPDKAMLKRIRDYHAHFQHDKGAYTEELSRGELLKRLAAFYEKNGPFTRRAFQLEFGFSRYRADKILTQLVSEPYPKYYREEWGHSYVYKKTGT